MKSTAAKAVVRFSANGVIEYPGADKSFRSDSYIIDMSGEKGRREKNRRLVGSNARLMTGNRKQSAEEGRQVRSRFIATKNQRVGQA